MEGLSSKCHDQGPPQTVKAIATHGKTEALPAQRTRETGEEAQRGVLEGSEPGQEAAMTGNAESEPNMGRSGWR